MRATECCIPGTGWRLGLLALAAVFVAQPAAAAGGPEKTESAPRLSPQILDAIIHIHTEVTPGSRTAAYLGSEREGSGVLIDSNGLIVTIGYLVMEAMAIEVTAADGKKVPASLVGLDNDSGLALVRTALPLAAKPLALGRSAALAERQVVLAAGFGGAEAAQAARVVSRRPFAGYWEYLLDDAIFTAPPLMNWSGAALIGSDGKLLGIGSLVVHDAEPGTTEPGNMFVPVDRLKASLADLLSTGRPATPPHPWLGINTQEIDGRLVVTRVSAEGPAEHAGLTRGSVVVAVAGEKVRDLAGFYRRLWAQGEAGVEVPLTVEEHGARREITIRTMNRYDYLKLDTTY
jgi:S1-C subfamily serine protease